MTGVQTCALPISYERGGITTDLQNRPGIRFETQIKQDAQVVAAEDESAP